MDEFPVIDLLDIWYTPGPGERDGIMRIGRMGVRMLGASFERRQSL
jgi:hypothetical protein